MTASTSATVRGQSERFSTCGGAAVTTWEGCHRARCVPYGRGWKYPVRTVRGALGASRFASRTYPTRQARTRSPHVPYGGPGARVSQLRVLGASVRVLGAGAGGPGAYVSASVRTTSSSRRTPPVPRSAASRSGTRKGACAWGCRRDQIGLQAGSHRVAGGITQGCRRD